VPDEGHAPPERLLDLGQGLALWRVHVDDLIEQPLNARAMTPAMFKRLQATIERDGRLESIPFAAVTSTDPVRIEVVSGHHRERAARGAAVFYVSVLADETGLTPDQIRAKQLAHNAIEGEDEAQIIARIFEAITDVDARLEAFIEPPGPPPAPVRLPRLELDLAYRTVQLVFLAGDAAEFERAMEQIKDDGALSDEAARLFLVDRDLFALWTKAVARFGREYDARAVTVQVSCMLRAALTHLGLTEPGLDVQDEWVPLAELLGSALVPPEAAVVIGQAVQALTKAGKAEPKAGWQAIVELCEDYQAAMG
jgi:ParB-like chromosome segregation protein Spo0J